MQARLHNRFHNRVLRRGAGHDMTIDGWASWIYDRFARWPLRGFYRRLAAEVSAVAPNGGTILDVGTGPGMLLVELAERRPDLRITGIDLSTDMVVLAERNVRRAGHAARVEVRTADVAALPFPDGTFDFVVSSLSMHHWGSVAPAVTELARVLRPGGALWIYDFRTLSDDTLTAAVNDAFGGPPHRSLRRTNRLPWPQLARWTVSLPVPPAGVGGE
jgi:ubiquinone/menaquinone biosynthesis C-methylase UbiE